ncbi:unnamed protein product [Calypogeia fissa]
MYEAANQQSLSKRQHTFELKQSEKAPSDISGNLIYSAWMEYQMIIGYIVAALNHSSPFIGSSISTDEIQLARRAIPFTDSKLEIRTPSIRRRTLPRISQELRRL